MSVIKNLKQQAKKIQMKSWYLIAVLMLSPCSALAAETGTNSWEGILKSIADSLTGPVAYAMSIIAIVVAGLVVSFADMQGGLKRFVQVALGFSIVFFAAQITTSFFHFSGAVI